MALTMSADKKQFDSLVLESSLPVVVDFWAPWCGPCLRLGPIIDELSTEYADKVRFVKVNVDENPEIAARYAVSGIPTLLFFKDGELLDRAVGALPMPMLRDAMDETFSL